MGSTASNIVPSKTINGKTYYDYDGTGNWVDGLGTPASDPNQGAPSSDYLQNVTAHDTQSGQTYNYNPLAYATPETATRLGTELNLPVSQTQQEYWPTSDPMQQVGGLNAGAVNDLIAKYGPPTPGSYSAYLIYRDLASSQGQSYIDPYAGGGPMQIGQGTAAALPGAYTSQYGTVGKAPATGAAGVYQAPPPAPPAPPPPPGTSGNTSTTSNSTTGGGTGGGLYDWLAQKEGASTGSTYGGQSGAGGTTQQTTQKTPGMTSNSQTTTDTGNTSTSGLTVTKSAYNNAYEGTATIGGTSQRVAILPDGRVFNSSGQDITGQIPPAELSSLQASFKTAANDPAYQPGSAPPSTTDQQQPPGSDLPPKIDAGYTQNGPITPPASGAPANLISPAGSPNYNPASTGFAYNAINGSENPALNHPYGGNVAPVFNTTGENVNTQAQNDRNLALQRGEQLGENLNEYTNQQYNAAGQFQNQLNSAWEPIASGQGGYSQAQQNAILQQPLLESLNQTEGEAQQSYRTPEEQKAITGTPWGAYQQLGKDEAGVNIAQNVRDAAVRGSLGQQEAVIFGALNSTQGAVRGAYNNQAGASNAALANQAGAVRGAYGNAAQNVNSALQNQGVGARSYLNPTALNVSSDYLNNYQFGDRDQQDVIDRAAQQVGYGNAAAQDQLLQQANAAGNTSPLALAAARQRMDQQTAVNQADAITAARIQAKQLALQTTQNRENTRLGAAQNYANLGTGTELTLGQQNVGAQQALGNQATSAEQYLGGSALNTAGTLGAAQQGAEQYLGSQAQQAQQFLGAARTGAEQTIGQSNINTQTDFAKTNLAAGTQAEQTASDRAAKAEADRVAAAQYNQNQRYTRGQNEYSALSGANTNFANTQLGQEQAYRSYLGGQQQQYGQNATIGNQQQISAYGTQTGGVNNATSNSVANAKTPDSGSASAIAGTIAGILGAAHAKGGVIPGPHPGLVGEAGPELLIQLNRVRPDEYGYPRYGGGGFIPGSDIQQADDAYTTPVSAHAQNYGYDQPQPKANPLYLQLLKQSMGLPQGPNDPYGAPQQPQQGGGGGLFQNLAQKGLQKLLGFADGGVVAPPNDSYLAPGVQYVDRPEVRELGANGPTAVVPLRQRKSNNIGVRDIPRLVEQYGNYGRA